MENITIQKLMLENAVLKMTGKHKPINLAQVVRALDDYSDYIEYDDEGKPVGKSVERAIRKMAEAEPNLFVVVEGDDNNDDGEAGPGFKGKGPGGGSPPAGAAEKFAAKKREALEMLGIKSEK